MSTPDAELAAAAAARTEVPRFGLIIVGDEILSGRRQDKHLSKVIELLNARGLKLAWAEIHGDDRDRLVQTFERSFAASDVVFSCGGIGGTPDDHTRQAAALALGVPLHRHPQAAGLIAQRCEETGQPLTEERLRMADFPQGCALIPNPYNRIAGFAIREHWFVPGFPVMAWPMLENVLDQYYAHLFHREAWVERSMLVFEAPEAALTPLMEAVEAQWPGVKVFSLPSVGGDGVRRHIELGAKGDPDSVGPAFERLVQGCQGLGYELDLQSRS